MTVVENVMGTCNSLLHPHFPPRHSDLVVKWLKSNVYQQGSTPLGIWSPKKGLGPERIKTKQLSQGLGEILQTMHQHKGAGLPCEEMNLPNRANQSKITWCWPRTEEQPRIADEATGTNNKPGRLRVLIQQTILPGGATSALKHLQIENNLKCIIVMVSMEGRTWLVLTVTNRFLIP